MLNFKNLLAKILNCDRIMFNDMIRRPFYNQVRGVRLKYTSIKDFE
jgi:hypothetical protein